MTPTKRCKGCAWKDGSICEVFINRNDPWLLPDGRCAAYATPEQRERIEEAIQRYAEAKGQAEEVQE